MIVHKSISLFFSKVSDIFNDDGIVVFEKKDGKQCWRCMYGDRSFTGLNGTKAVKHLAKIDSKDIKKCGGKQPE